MLTLSDRALQRAYEDEQARQYHGRVSRIPIPVTGGSELNAHVRHELQMPRSIDEAKG